MSKKKVSTMSNEELIKSFMNCEKLQKEQKKESDIYKAELEKRAKTIMDDTNVKFVKFYGQDSFASVTEALKLEVLNMENLEKLFGSGLIKEQVTKIEKLDYKWKAKFEKVLKVVFTGDYILDTSLESFLGHMSVSPTPEQKKVLMKRLKGDFDKDKKVLEALFGEEYNFDVELFFIYKIKNGELIKAFLPDDDIEARIEKIKKCILVETSTAIKIDYKEAEE